jgi:hypothetical protein
MSNRKRKEIARKARRAARYIENVDDYHRLHPQIVATVKTVKPMNLIRFLTVKNEFWTAQAVWNRINGVWSCAMADRRLRWMVGQTPGQVQIELLRLEADWSWGTESASPTVPVDNRPNVPEDFDSANVEQRPLPAPPSTMQHSSFWPASAGRN